MRFVLFKRVTVDDGRINPPEIQKIIDVFGGAAGYDRKNVHCAAIIHDARDFRRETDGCTLQKTPGQTDRPGIEPIPYLRLSRDGR